MDEHLIENELWQRVLEGVRQEHLSRMPPHHPLNPCWVRGALATPQPAASLVHDADRRQLL